MQMMEAAGVNWIGILFVPTGTGASHEPPGTLVMKEQRWFVANEMVTQLLNSSGEVKYIRCFAMQSLKFMFGVVLIS